MRVAWISTRRTSPAADAIAANITGRYLLHEALGAVKLPLDEFSCAHLVVLEIPPVCYPRAEHDVLSLIAKIRSTGPHVAVVIQPSVRRQTQKAHWVHRWNKLDARPFDIRMGCSCKGYNLAPGVILQS